MRFLRRSLPSQNPRHCANSQANGSVGVGRRRLFLQSCFGFNDVIGDAFQLSQISLHILKWFPASSRDDLENEHFELFSDVLNIFLTTVSHHDAIQVSVLSGHGLASLIQLRPQMESLLTLAYVLEPDPDLAAVAGRVDQLRQWTMVQMKKNFDRSSSLNLVQMVSDQPFRDQINQNYETVRQQLSPAAFKDLNKRSNFLTSDQRLDLAKKLGIEDYYSHIYAESSASIHFADMSDRIESFEDGQSAGYRFQIRQPKGTFWPLLLSVRLQMQALRVMAKFMGIEDAIDAEIKRRIL